MQVRIPLVDASKNYQLLKNLFKSSCTGVYQWFDCHLPGAVVSQGISPLNVENCSGFPPPLDSRHLRSRIAYSLTSISCIPYHTITEVSFQLQDLFSYVQPLNIHCLASSNKLFRQGEFSLIMFLPYQSIGQM